MCSWTSQLISKKFFIYLFTFFFKQTWWKMLDMPYIKIQFIFYSEKNPYEI